MAIPPIPSAPTYREAIKSETQPVPDGQTVPAVPGNIDPTVLVNGKPVVNKDEAAAKASEHKWCGQVQEAKVRSIYESTKDQNVKLNPRPTSRDDGESGRKNCGKD